MGFSFDQDRQEWTTMAQVQPARRRRWGFSVVVSTGVHVLVLVLLCWPALPLFVRPNVVAHGEGGSETLASTVLYAPNDISFLTEPQTALLHLPAKTKVRKSRLRKRTNALDVEKPGNSVEAGSLLGSGYDGPASGDEVKPALPAMFQEFKIPRSDLPNGLHGDVIVEITIDAEGKVVGERLLQGVGAGVDERVISAVRDWRYRPATRNGVPIPSKRDVYFHFPS
jgi:TonB family protein